MKEKKLSKKERLAFVEEYLNALHPTVHAIIDRIESLEQRMNALYDAHVVQIEVPETPNKGN